jgi:hypothetical protein
MEVKKVEKAVKKDVELRIHNKRYKEEGGYWNEFKGIYGKKKSNELLEESIVKIYDFAYYGIDAIKVDFDYKYWEKIAMFLTALYKKQYDNKNCTDWERIYCESPMLRLYLGDDYNLILKRLEELHIIELQTIESKYNKSKTCKYISLNQNFIEIEGVIYTEKNLISEKYQDAILKYFNKKICERDGVTKYIETVLDTCTFSLDNRDALNLEIAENKFKKESQSLLNPYVSESKKIKIKIKIDKKDSYIKNHNKIMNRYYENLVSKLNSIDLIKKEHYNITVSPFGNRISHIFSSMPKKYRKRLMIEGEEVIEIDIVSSQVAFLLILLKRWFESDSEVKLKSATPFMMIEKLEMLYSKGSKLDLYKYMSLKLHGLKAIPNKDIRSQMKLVFQELIFDRTANPDFKDKNKKELIIHLFGKDFFEVLQEIQRLDIEGIDIKKHRNISALLQREESKFLSEVMSQLMNDKVMFLPLYDSLIVKKSDKQKVEEAFKLMTEKNGFTDFIRIK